MKNVYQKLVAAIGASVGLLVLAGVASASVFQVSGTVKNQSSVPLSGAAVDVINASDGSVVTGTTTDSNGYYTLSIAAGTYNVRVTPPAGSGFQTSIALNRVISGDTVLDFVLVPSGVAGLNGRIKDRFGNGLGGVQVNLSASGGGSAIQVTTDNTGAYAFQVAPGDYALAIYGYDNAAAFNAPRYFALYATGFTLSANTIADITVPTHRVTVHVQDPAGNPVANTIINSNTPYASGLSIGPFSGYGYSGYPTWMPAAVTDAGGDLVMWLFPNADSYNTYTLTATPPSGSPFVTFNISNISVSSDKDIVVVLQFVHDSPVTTANLSPLPDGNGEYPNPTIVSLSATAFSGFTVAATYYRVDSGSTQTYTAPFTVSGAGPHTIRYWSVDNGGVFEIPITGTFTISSRQLTALGTADIWLGLKNSDDVGTNFDLFAEVLKNGSVVGSGQLNNVPGGSSGFNNAVLRTINLALSSPVTVSAGDTLRIRLSVRIAVGVTGHRSGTARLWFNDAAANSRFAATIGGTTKDYFLLNGFALGTAAGPSPQKTIDVFVDRAVGGNPFKPFGTWSKTF